MLRDIVEKGNSEQLNTRSWAFNSDNPKMKRAREASKTNGVKLLIRETRPKSNKRFTNFLLTLFLLQHHHLINFSQYIFHHSYLLAVRAAESWSGERNAQDKAFNLFPIATSLLFRLFHFIGFCFDFS